MEESKIAMKLEAETKDLTHICERLTEAIKHELDNGIENVNTKEMGEAVDMLKDLYEAKEKMVKACYYKQFMEAMEEEAGGEEEWEDDGRRGYRGQPRDSMGRYMSRRGRRGGRRGYEEPWDEVYDYNEMERMRDVDRPSMNRMYYSGSSSSGQSSGGSGMSGGNMGGGSSGSSGGSSSGSRGYEESRGGSYGRSEGRDSREGRSGGARRGYMEAKEIGKEKAEKMKELETYMKELSSDVTEMISDASPEEKAMLKSKMQTLLTKIQ